MDSMYALPPFAGLRDIMLIIVFLQTTWCRYIHRNMVPIRPNIHCAHIGPSGGDMCSKCQPVGNDAALVTTN